MASHRNLAAAWDRGFFDDLVTPYLGVTRDGTLPADTSSEKLARLAPVFGHGPNATMTAGNPTPLTDCAARVLVAERSRAAELGWPALARVVDAQVGSPTTSPAGRICCWHLCGHCRPCYGVPALAHVDLIEVHEAFAATVLATFEGWKRESLGDLDRSRLNINGSSLAAGHPFAATGARIVASLAKILAQRGAGSLGLVSICAAEGQGVVAILEGM